MLTENTYHPAPSLAVGRMAVMGVLLFLCLRILSMMFPAVKAIGDGPVSSGRELVRVGWLSGCDNASALVGLFRLQDAPCQPGAMWTLQQLRDELVLNKILPGIVQIKPIRNVTLAHCPAMLTVQQNNSETMLGWLCADVSGLYLADAAGNPLNADRWQRWSDGSWENVGLK